MNREYRFGLAAILAPLTVPVAFLALSLTQPGFTTEAIGPSEVTILVVITAVSYGGLLLLGVPIVVVLKRTNMLTLWSLCIGGAVGGAIVGYATLSAFRADVLPTQSAPSIIGPLASFACLGILVAGTFGLIARVKAR